MASLLVRRAVPTVFASVAVRPHGAVTVAAMYDVLADVTARFP